MKTCKPLILGIGMKRKHVLSAFITQITQITATMIQIQMPLKFSHHHLRLRHRLIMVEALLFSATMMAPFRSTTIPEGRNGAIIVAENIKASTIIIRWRSRRWWWLNFSGIWIWIIVAVICVNAWWKKLKKYKRDGIETIFKKGFLEFHFTPDGKIRSFQRTRSL